MRFVIVAGGLLLLAKSFSPAQGTKESNQKPAADTQIQEIGGKTLQEWIKEIPSEDRSRGENAIRTVQAFGPDRACAAVPLLIKELKKQTHARKLIDVSIRVNAVMALGSILGGAERPDPEEVNAAVTVLTLLLHDSQAVVKYRAVEALGKIGRRAKPAIPELLTLLRDPYTTWETRQAAATVLGLIALDRENKKGPPASVVKGLYGALSDSAFQVRRAAIQSMTFIGTPANTSKADRDAFVSHLKKATSEKEDPTVRIWARMAIMSISHEISQTDVLAICKTLKDRDPSARAQAAQALTICGGSAFADPQQVKERGIVKLTIQPLIAALDDKEPVVALNAMTALLSMGKEGKGALPALQEISRDRKRPRALREAVLEAIKILSGNNAQTASIPQMIVEDEQKAPINTQIQELGGKTLEEWIKDIGSKDRSRGEHAILMVQAFGADRALQAVTALLAELKRKDVEVDVSVRVNAIMALGNILGLGGAEKPGEKLVDDAVKTLSFPAREE
jgi:HEAT repeat protein